MNRELSFQCPHCGNDIDVSVGVSGPSASSNGTSDPDTEMGRKFFILKGEHLRISQKPFLTYAKQSEVPWNAIRDHYALVHDADGNEFRAPVRQLGLGGLTLYNPDRDWRALGVTTNDCIRLLTKLGIRVRSYQHTDGDSPT